MSSSVPAEHQELVKANLFSWAVPNLRVLFLPLRFVGYWLQWKIWSPDPNARQAKTLVDNIIYGEDPRFRVTSRELYFVDMHGRKVLKYSLSTGETTLVYEDPDDMLSGLGWLPDGRMLIVSMNNRRILVHDEKTSSTEVYADVRDVTAFRANDMVVDRSGRAYVGSFGFDMANVAAYSRSAVISVGVNGGIRVEAPDMIFPNGMVLAPDGKTLIVAETFAGLLTAFDIGEEGRLSNRRVWANIGSFVDGICLDADGCVWASIPQSGLYPTGGGLLRVQEGGEVLEVLGFGANGIKNSVFACQLGTDEDGKHLLFFMEAVTSFDHLIFKDGREAAKMNGSVREIEPEQEEDPLVASDVGKLKQQQELFQKVSPNTRMLFFPFRFLGYWLGRKLWFEDPNEPKARTLLNDIIYGEGPRFRASAGELYFTDMHDKKVIKYALATEERTLVYDDPEDMLSGLGWLPDGRLLISSMNKRQVLVHDEATGTTEVYADVQDVTKVRANDMVVATSGRAYLGSFGFNNTDFKAVSSAAIASVGPGGYVRVEATGLGV
ncbi:hypothetical protein ON010_g12467 [Phytophthora cinnamomi]|nr:hypothetical protein ON010_g12467 [Phytophthora cinnamomi]